MSTWPRSKLWRNRQVSQLASQWRSVMASNFRREPPNLLQVCPVVKKIFRKVACWLGWRDLRIQLSPKLDSWGTLVCHQSLSHLHCLKPNQLTRLILQTKVLKIPLKPFKCHKTQPLQLKQLTLKTRHHRHRQNPTQLTLKSQTSKKIQPTTVDSQRNPNHPETTVGTSQILKLWFSLNKIPQNCQLMESS